jgi:hypothetical protein
VLPALANAIGMIDIIALGFNPRIEMIKNAIGMTDLIALGFNPRDIKK